VCRTPRRIRPRARGGCILAGVVTIATASAARAEVGLGISAASDYRYRGTSLSDEHANLALDLSYDHRSGLYAGVKAILASPRGGQPELTARMHYGGFVARTRTGLAIDAGLINYNLKTYRGSRRTVDYSEAYLGLVAQHVSARLYYAPDYYRSHVRTLYADLGTSLRPAPESAPALRLFGHAGMLIPVGGRNFPQARKSRYDLKAGAAMTLGRGELSLTWTRLSPPYLSHRLGGEHAERLTVGAAYFF
jgi:uncharacterized protein (TIGR02001 family)